MSPRLQTIRDIEGVQFDLCVIGGGATGAGTALDAQLRGLRTLLVDSGDFASGTSSASTKLVHGGVRYLEQAVKTFDLAEYRMVQGALHERASMLRNAPHLAHVAEFLVPVYSWFQATYFRIGLKIYDLLAGKKNLFQSKILSRAETLKRLPGLKSAGLYGAIAYADGQFDDARYAMALVRSFQDAGGKALNYCRAESFVWAGGKSISGAQLHDAIGQNKLTIQAKIVVNATGPFSDKIRQLANPSASPRLRPSKGAHLLFPRELFPGKDALLVPETEDKRVIFAVPWQGRLLVGTTEDEATPETKMAVSHGEAEYMLRPLRVEQAVSGFAGLRPLVASGGDKHSTKELIRDHEVEADEQSGLISILGGKWTTHRLMAEDTVDAVQRALGQIPSKSGTKEHTLNGAAAYTADLPTALEREYGLPAATAKHLSGKFGANAARVLDLARQNADLSSLLVDGFPALRVEVVYCARAESAQTIEDVLARRLGLQLYDWRASIVAAPAVGALLARELGWSDAQKATDVARYIEKIRGFLRELGLSEA